MRARLEAVDATRRRITEATVRLHERVGPAATTVSAVAEEAGVTRLTVYRHFPDDEALVSACSAHWSAGHPAPDPQAWADEPDPVARLELALRQTYDWWLTAAPMMAMILRDVETMPAFVGQLLAEDEAARVAVLARPFAAREGPPAGCGRPWPTPCGSRPGSRCAPTAGCPTPRRRA